MVIVLEKNYYFIKLILFSSKKVIKLKFKIINEIT